MMRFMAQLPPEQCQTPSAPRAIQQESRFFDKIKGEEERSRQDFATEAKGSLTRFTAAAPAFLSARVNLATTSPCFSLVHPFNFRQE
jgi:hypothetical protein